MRTRFVLLVLSSFAGAAPLAGQGEIVYNDAVFRRTATPFDETPTGDLVGVSPVPTADHLFETGWWFRIDGDPREYPFPVPTSQSYVGDTSILAWTDVAGRGLFDAEETSEVYDGGFPHQADLGSVYVELLISNRSDTEPLAIHLFHFADLDLQPAFNDDSVQFAEWTVFSRIFELTDPGASFSHYQALQASAYLVRPYGATDVAAVLSDADVDDFDDSGLPFGPGDMTAGYQFSWELGPGGQGTAYILLGVNWNVRCLSSNVGLLCDGFEIGNASLWSQVVP